MAVSPVACDAPVVIVGAGPAGMRVAQDLRRLKPHINIVIYGDEPWDPYSRVGLSSFMAAQIDRATLMRDQHLPASIEKRIGCKVVAIEPRRQRVIDATGRAQAYSALVLATGSSPFIPNIPGIQFSGVYTLRDLTDADRLLARQVRSRRTVVLGGGLLGLEAARGMQRFNTQVCVVELADRLMPRQLDHGAAAQLKLHVEAAGIEVTLGDAVEQVLGDGVVRSIALKSGRKISCDTVVVATGIIPVVDLARGAGLEINRGVLVNDHMQTSDPLVYAVGECAEHAERRTGRTAGARIYGAAAPSLEQATVAAHVIAADDARYSGGPVAMRLKVLGAPVFSMGRVNPDTLLGAKPWIYSDAQAGVYRKLATYKGKLVGAIGVGEWSKLTRVQGAITLNRRVWPWQLWRFRLTGSPWRDAGGLSVSEWPAIAAVCNCTGVTRGRLGAAIAEGHCTVKELAACTGASTVCGACRPLLAELVGSANPEPVHAHRTLLAVTLAALTLVLALGPLPNAPYSDTLDLAWRWDKLWRDDLFKQVSGFSALTLMTVGLVLLVTKKRILSAKLDEFGVWRWIHVTLGVGALLALTAHTGGRLGSALNLWLIACVLCVVFAGSVLSDSGSGGGISPQAAADAIHAVIEADGTAYSRLVINRLVDEEKVIKASEHWEDDKALPLPAQMLRAGSELAQEQGVDFSYSLQSLWPINSQNEPKTAVETKGLEFVAKNPDQNFYQEEELGGDTYFTAVYPDKAIAETCVTCHNNHPTTPRTDYKLNDVMGGIVIRLPL